MKKYPEIITDEIGLSQDSVDDATVDKDIRETELEINVLKLVQDSRLDGGFTFNSAEQRLSDFRMMARVGQIADRTAFVEFLKKLQVWRMEYRARIAQ